MDKFDTCNDCTEEIGRGDKVIVTMDAKREQEDFEDVAAYREDEGPYRGVYCPNCWDALIWPKKPIKICDNCLCKDQPIGEVVELVDESTNTCEWEYCTENRFEYEDRET